MTAVRQRIPFRFSEDEGSEGHILDEQEQEEVIERLREQSAGSNTVYLIGLQGVIGLSILLSHFLYILRSPKQSPLVALFPDTPSSEPVPLATPLTLLQVLIHCNLSLYVLSLFPPGHPLRQALRGSAFPAWVRLPIPISQPAALFIPAVAPVYALVLGRSWPDVLWWATSGIITAVVVAALKWMKDEEQEIATLEKLRYTARGA
ncbi:hypothetical protein C8Q79DRAFT_548549 [Trametes meyenii]|nr:hypothetical protein C8Q79DRAFT_548549 [Trametes meyenii]